MYVLPGKLLVEVLEAEVVFSNWAQAKAKKVKANRGFQSEKNRGWYFSEPSDLLFIFLHALHILLISHLKDTKGPDHLHTCNRKKERQNIESSPLNYSVYQ